MSFYEILQNYSGKSDESLFSQVTAEDVEQALSKSKTSIKDFIVLLSPAAENYLETMARRAQELTLQHFGRSILLYTPIYISNFCVNRCLYCSYNIENEIRRKKLSMDEIEEEAAVIAKTGLRHILLLTGESRKASPVTYIADAVTVLRRHFDSVGIEIYPLEEDEYREVVHAGVDGLTLYQEVYDEEIYKKVHAAGPKRDYRFRLDAPERACRSGIRNINVGALLGLGGWRREALFTGLHAGYLQDIHPEVEVSVSLPRIRPYVGCYDGIYEVKDRNLVQILLALRIFLPYAGITLSTRERQQLRDHLIPLGVTKMSAGVSTEVGGRTAEQKGEGQFEISDGRSVVEIRQTILDKGYQPVFKDWMSIAGVGELDESV